jgi:hypothetical protein
MPTIQLAVVVNLTGTSVELSNTENPADNITIGANNVEVAGARSGTTNIPECSSQQNLNNHHVAIQTPNQTYYLWKTDSGDGKNAEIRINTQPQLSTNLISGSPLVRQNLNKALWITPTGLQMTDTDLIPKSQQYNGNISATRTASAGR